jgi:hypothetical protein
MLDFPNEEKYSIAKPGKKTKTSFRGTISYCGEEMRKCYSNLNSEIRMSV